MGKTNNLTHVSTVTTQTNLCFFSLMHFSNFAKKTYLVGTHKPLRKVLLLNTHIAPCLELCDLVLLTDNQSLCRQHTYIGWSGFALL